LLNGKPANQSLSGATEPEAIRRLPGIGFFPDGLQLFFEIGEMGWITDVIGFHAFEVGLPTGGSDGGIAAGTDGIDGAVCVEAMGKPGGGVTRRGHFWNPERCSILRQSNKESFMDGTRENPGGWCGALDSKLMAGDAL
jgi:hypothetical protein